MKLLQKILQFISILTLILLLGCRIAHCPLSPAIEFYVLPILASAAVGYLTNNIAITMLFKPFDRQSLLPKALFARGFISDGRWLAIVSFGLWRQGVIPANKKRIGGTLAREIPHYLLNSEDLADSISEQTLEFIFDNPALLSQLRNSLNNYLENNTDDIANVAAPEIKRAILNAIDQANASGQISALLSDMAEGWIAQPENRLFIANIISAKLKDYSPVFMQMARNAALVKTNELLERNPMFSMVASMFGGAEGIVDKFDWDSIEETFIQKITSPMATQAIAGELLGIGTQLRSWQESAEGQEKLAGIMDTLRLKANQTIDGYIQQNAANMIRTIIDSDSLWLYLQNTLLPKFKDTLSQWLHGDGRTIIMNALNLENRIQNAIDNMDVRQFHAMLLTVVEEHLGMIQILGWILGAIVGIII